MPDLVRGINYPSRTYPSVVAAVTHVGAVTGPDYENAGQIDVVRAAIERLNAQVTDLQRALALKTCEELNLPGPTVGTGADQKLAHSLGIVPTLVIVVEVDPSRGDSHTMKDYVAKDDKEVTIRVTKDAKVRVFVVR